MTEKEWQDSRNIVAMMNQVRQIRWATDRRLRLWVEACRDRWPDSADNTDLDDPTVLQVAVGAWASGRVGVPEAEIVELLRDVVVWRGWWPEMKPEWRLSQVVQVARAVYQGRNWPELPVLADCLEDAGCDHGALLGHLRGGGLHTAGCWALETVLGAEVTGEPTDIGFLLGKTLKAAEYRPVRPSHTDEILFTLEDGKQYRLWHCQDGCEHVQVEDICGDLHDLVGRPITLAEEAINTAEADEDCNTHTWTFYRLATDRGYVTIRWSSESNGYYSDSVNFGMVKE